MMTSVTNHLFDQKIFAENAEIFSLTAMEFPDKTQMVLKILSQSAISVDEAFRVVSLLVDVKIVESGEEEASVAITLQENPIVPLHVVIAKVRALS